MPANVISQLDTRDLVARSPFEMEKHMQPVPLCLRKLRDVSEVTAATGLSRSSIYRAIRSGEFPKPIKISASRVAWIEDELEGWIGCKAAARAGDRTT